MEQHGELAIVLHTHMPYVEGGGEWPPTSTDAYLRSPEGFGTWPFGEEWLWEAIATCYLPLLDVLASPGGDASPSLTPVLCDQLELAGAIDRCLRFLHEIRSEPIGSTPTSWRRPATPSSPPSWSGRRPSTRPAARRLSELAGAGGLLAALSPRELDLVGDARHPAAAGHRRRCALQVQTGIESHRRRFGGWDGGFWLPECAHAPWLDPLLEDAGVRATCVELTGLFGLGDPRHLRPLGPPTGRCCGRSTGRRSRWCGGGTAIRRRRLPRLPRHTTHRHHVWRNDGGPV